MTIITSVFMLIAISVPPEASAREHEQTARRRRAGLNQDPCCVGWDGAWVLQRYSLRKGRWMSWKSMPAELPAHACTGIGRRFAGVIGVQPGDAGWLFHARSKEWAQITGAPITRELSEGVGAFLDGISAWFDRDRLVVWGLTTWPKSPPPHGAIYDPTTGEWTPMSEAPIEPRYRSINAIIGRKLYIWGGFPNFHQDGAAYDLDNDTWERLPVAPVRFRYGMASAVWHDQLIVFGGNKSRQGAIYDPRETKWSPIEDSPFDVGVMSACAVVGDELFLWSGKATNAKDGSALNEGALYDIVRRQWKQVARSPLPPRMLPFAHAVNNRVVVWGGWDYEAMYTVKFFLDGAIYDVSTNSWERIPDLPTAVPEALHPGW